MKQLSTGWIRNCQAVKGLFRGGRGYVPNV